MRSVLQNSCPTIKLKNLDRKYMRRNLSFCKVAGCRTTTLIRLISFTGIFKDFNQTMTFALYRKAVLTDICSFPGNRKS